MRTDNAQSSGQGEAQPALWRPVPARDVVLDQDGREWRITEQGLVGPDGELAARLSGHLAYWVGWFAFFPNTLLYSGE